MPTISAMDRRRNPNSKTQKRLANRTKELMTPEMLGRRDNFIDGLLQGMSKRNAAIYAGVPIRSAYKEGSSLWSEPYVIEKFAKLREALDEAVLITRKEQILNVKSIAFDDDQPGNFRVSAHSLLSKIMGFDAPIKLTGDINLTGGVMLVPVAKDTEDWQSLAEASQTKLKEDVRK